MSIEFEHFDVLQNLESAVFRFYQANPALTDYQVDKVFETLVQAYRGEAIGKEIPPPRGELAAPLYERLRAVCEWRLGRADLQKGMLLAPEDAIPVDVLVECLKRLRKSLDLWTKEGGSQGYLMYISQFMEEMDEMNELDELDELSDLFLPDDPDDPEEESNQVYQFKLTLDGIRPPVWRRIQVRASDTLQILHHIIQMVMGWTDTHLHEFEIDGLSYGNPDIDESNFEDESDYFLDEVLEKEGQKIHYLYDFGDSWEHTLVLEKILDPEEGQDYPRCLAGKRACPPEDVGGVWGYQRMLEAISDPGDPEHEEYLEWLGEEFDPEYFDLEEVNKILRIMADPMEREAIEILARVLELPYEAEAENLALRKDALAFVNYLQENKVTATKETGNLPRKAVREIAARFVDPPVLDFEQDGKKHSFQSDHDVPDVFFIHLLLATAGLILLGPGRRWIPSELGEEISDMPWTLQVWMLFSSWWHLGDWPQTYQFSAIAEEAMEAFKDASLDLLLDYDAEETVLYADFIERLIEEMELMPGMENRDHAMLLLKGGVQMMLIEMLAKFGMLQKEYEVNKIGNHEFQELHSFRLTPFGMDMLEILA